MDLKEMRDAIDDIDNKLVELFKERMDISIKIADYKKKNKIPIGHPTREEEITKRVVKDLDPHMKIYAATIFKTLFKVSRDLQNKIINEDRKIYEDNSKEIFGLLGEKVDNSLSPEIHAKFSNYRYELFSVPKENLDEFFKERNFKGINITMPYKEEVMKYCDEISEIAKEIGSVNTIIKREDGTLYGDNTDYKGFLYLLEYKNISLKGAKILILGSGGASKSIALAAKKSEAKEIIVISRTGENNYNNLYVHGDADIIINATPVGMYPHNGLQPIDLRIFDKCSCVIDIIYNPLETALISQAKELDIKTANGLSMLVAQAYYASILFTDSTMPEIVIKKVIKEIEQEQKNIIFIGMPGSGKSTMAYYLSHVTGKPVIDIDELIEDKQQMSISKIFQNYGEEAFRKMETDAILEVGKSRGNLISTGGGAVLNIENIKALQQNGFLIFLNRKLENLDTKDRPLSSDFQNIEKMYKERYPLYKKYSDMEINVKEGISLMLEELANKVNN